MRFVDRSRTSRPKRLDALKDGKTELERARDHFKPGVQDGFEFSIYSDAEVKEALRTLFDGKCAYCESFYFSTQPEDVEHYRPKGRIDSGTAKLKPGYWWLASEWENLLPSCIDCNRERTHEFPDGTKAVQGKGDKFPLADESQRATAEGGHLHETPLLLNPCADRPEQYIRFSDEGGDCMVVPIDGAEGSLPLRRARTSIEVYALNRPGLVRERSRHMRDTVAQLKRVRRLIKRLDEAAPPDRSTIEEELAEELAVLKEKRSEIEPHVGMTRWLIDPEMEKMGLTMT
jgi:uncharacterized protein (TIGR02646 family)